MSKTTDIIVVGSGLAGLMAAHEAAAAGCRTRVFSEGMGCLAIGPGCVDLLGYDPAGKRLDNPWDGFGALPAEHPYSILGKANVKAALDSFTSAVTSQNLTMTAAGERNFLMPTIVGTLKPTWLFQADIDPDIVQKAKRVLVVSVKGFRDCRPALIISQLRRYRDWADKEFVPAVLPEPFKEHGRSLNALDVAHVADREIGAQWLLGQLANLGKNFDLALVPPIFGSRANSPIRQALPKTLGCPYLEMLSVPPGVGGLRIRDALVKTLEARGVEFFENAQITRAEIRDGKSARLTAHASGRDMTHHASAVVVATGGILGGGVILGHGKAYESIFGIDIPVPEDVDNWSEPDIFGKHLVTSLGVKVNDCMRAIEGENGNPYPQNVFFAGRTLGGYDYATEKSGNGVAIATGWMAGRMAAARAQNRLDAQPASGAEK